jgi:hypothetical protein
MVQPEVYESTYILRLHIEVSIAITAHRMQEPHDADGIR